MYPPQAGQPLDDPQCGSSHLDLLKEMHGDREEGILPPEKSLMVGTAQRVSSLGLIKKQDCRVEKARTLGSERPEFKSYQCSVTLGKLPNLSEPCSLLCKMGTTMPTLQGGSRTNVYCSVHQPRHSAQQMSVLVFPALAPLL